jgi:hypothetical protein
MSVEIHPTAKKSGQRPFKSCLSLRLPGGCRVRSNPPLTTFPKSPQRHKGPLGSTQRQKKSRQRPFKPPDPGGRRVRSNPPLTTFRKSPQRHKGPLRSTQRQKKSGQRPFKPPASGACGVRSNPPLTTFRKSAQRHKDPLRSTQRQKKSGQRPFKSRRSLRLPGGQALDPSNGTKVRSATPKVR